MRTDESGKLLVDTLALLDRLLAEPGLVEQAYAGKQGCMCGCGGTYVTDARRVKARLRAAIRKLEDGAVEEVDHSGNPEFGHHGYLYLGYESAVDAPSYRQPRGRCSCFYFAQAVPA